MNLKRRTLAAGMALGLLALPGLAGAQDTRQAVAAASMIEEVKRNGTLRIGLSTFVPWAMNARTGELVGFEIDVARRLAEDMGVKVEFVPTAWDGIIPALIAGKFDLIISGMSITPVRNLTVNFTVPYASSGIGLAASRRLAGGFATLADFNKPTVKIALRRGATPVPLAQKLFPEAELLQFDEEAQVIQEVLNGQAHAFMTSEPKPTFEALKAPEILFQPFGETLSRTAEAMAVRKGDPDALNFLNNWILLRSFDGFLKERHDYWFKTRAWASMVEG